MFRSENISRISVKKKKTKNKKQNKTKQKTATTTYKWEAQHSHQINVDLFNIRNIKDILAMIDSLTASFNVVYVIRCYVSTEVIWEFVELASNTST